MACEINPNDQEGGAEHPKHPPKSAPEVIKIWKEFKCHQQQSAAHRFEETGGVIGSDWTFPHIKTSNDHQDTWIRYLFHQQL